MKEDEHEEARERECEEVRENEHGGETKHEDDGRVQEHGAVKELEDDRYIQAYAKRKYDRKGPVLREVKELEGNRNDRTLVPCLFHRDSWGGKRVHVP